MSDTGRARVGIGSLLVLLVCSLVLVGIRFGALSADPPVDMSTHYVTDEGWWAHNARQHFLFGRWIMDDHNVALIGAPLYTGVLRLIYQLFGVGLWQSRALAAASGLATCAVVYPMVSISHGRRAAGLSALLLGANFLWLSYNRVAFVESFQTVFLTLTCLAVIAATRSRTWGALAGVAFVVAVLAKISAAGYLAAIGMFWIWQFASLVRDPNAARGARRLMCESAGLFVASSAIGALLVWLVLVLPHQAQFQTGAEQLTGLAGGPSPLLGIFTVGIERTLTRLYTSPFVIHTPWLLAAMGLIGMRQLGSRQPLDATARCCWCWLVCGLVVIGMRSHFDVDRRYLPLLPPLTILIGIELARGGLTILGRDDFKYLGLGWRRFASAALPAVVLGFAVRTGLTNYLFEVGPNWNLGRLGGLGALGASALAWLIIAVAAMLVLLLLTFVLPRRSIVIPAWLVMLIIVGTDARKASNYFSGLTYTLPDAIERFSEISGRMASEDRIVLGDTADTIGLDSDAFTFIIRRWEHNRMFMNLDGWQRFQPTIVLGEEAGDRFVHVASFRLAPDRQGNPRLIVPMYMSPEYGQLFRPVGQ